MNSQFFTSLSKLKQYDVFGHKLGVTYKGQGAYTTVAGTICTLIVTVFSLIDFIMISSEYTQGSYSEEDTSTYFNRRLSDPYKLGENGVDILFQDWRADERAEGGLPSDEKYVKWKVFQTKPYEDGYNPEAKNSKKEYIKDDSFAKAWGD